MCARKRFRQFALVLPMCALVFGSCGDASAQSAWQKMKLQFLEQACKGGDQNSCRQLVLLKQKLSQQAGHPTAPQPQAQPQQTGQPTAPSQQGADVANGTTAGPVPVESAGQQSGGSQEAWAPPAGDSTPAHPTGPLDPLKLPDIQGIHPGMTVEQATQIVAKLAPGIRIPWYNSPMLIPTSNIVVGHAAYMVTVQYDYINVGGGQKNYTHELNLDATKPPNQERIWHIGFQAQIQHINRSVLLEALRKKYGKELFATDLNGQLTHDDSRINHLWWAFDEQGHPKSPAPAFVNSSPNGCTEPGFNTAARPYGDDDQSSRNPAKNPGCMFVGLHATWPNGEGEILSYYSLSLWDAPLSVRDYKVTDAWLQMQLEKARQESLQRSKEAKPTL